MGRSLMSLVHGGSMGIEQLVRNTNNIGIPEICWVGIKTKSSVLRTFDDTKETSMPLPQ